jgi:hypothetical protein
MLPDTVAVASPVLGFPGVDAVLPAPTVNATLLAPAARGAAKIDRATNTNNHRLSTPDLLQKSSNEL